MSRSELLKRVSEELGFSVPYYRLQYAIASGRVPEPTERVGTIFVYCELHYSAFVAHLQQQQTAKQAS